MNELVINRYEYDRDNYHGIWLIAEEKLEWGLYNQDECYLCWGRWYYNFPEHVFKTKR